MTRLHVTCAVPLRTAELLLFPLPALLQIGRRVPNAMGAAIACLAELALPVCAICRCSSDAMAADALAPTSRAVCPAQGYRRELTEETVTKT